VIFEGIFIGLMSWVMGIILSFPLSVAIGNLLGNLSFRSPLPLIISPAGIVVWLIIIVGGSTAASAFPAWKASRLTIRETLTYI
jgi:putative ABC transport system permease protein